MIWVVATDLGLDYGSWVKLYQSRYFEDEFPEDNARFQNVTYTEEVGADRERSLRAMRKRMLNDHRFSAAVFVGGMGGIVDEFELFRQLQPNVKTLPIASTGGATLDLRDRMPSIDRDLIDDLDYVALFHRHLDISVKERRYRHPDEQPADVLQRFWRPADGDHSPSRGSHAVQPDLPSKRATAARPSRASDVPARRKTAKKKRAAKKAAKKKRSAKKA